MDGDACARYVHSQVSFRVYAAVAREVLPPATLRETSITCGQGVLMKIMQSWDEASAQLAPVLYASAAVRDALTGDIKKAFCSNITSRLESEDVLWIGSKRFTTPDAPLISLAHAVLCIGADLAAKCLAGLQSDPDTIGGTPGSKNVSDWQTHIEETATEEAVAAEAGRLRTIIQVFGELAPLPASSPGVTEGLWAGVVLPSRNRRVKT